MILMTSTNQAVEIATGVSMPMVGFGTWQITGEAAYTSTRFALDVGYRHIDTALLYGNEAQVGRALRDSGVPREDVFVTTKLPPDRANRVQATIEGSLAALGLDYVDLWLIMAAGGWPGDQGLAGLPGGARQPPDPGGRCQQLLADRDRRSDQRVGEAPAINQISWSPWKYEAVVLAGHRERGIAVEGYSGLRGADLADPVLVQIAAAHGVTAAQVILRWHLEHDIIVIPKSVHEDRIRENFDLYRFALTPEETARIDALSL